MSANMDQIIPVKIDVVEIDPGETVYLKVDEAGRNANRFIGIRMIGATRWIDYDPRDSLAIQLNPGRTTV